MDPRELVAEIDRGDHDAAVPGHRRPRRTAELIDNGAPRRQKKQPSVRARLNSPDSDFRSTVSEARTASRLSYSNAGYRQKSLGPGRTTDEPRCVPDLLQTAEYARAAFELSPIVKAADIDELVQVKLRRQSKVDENRHNRMWFLVDEQALRRRSAVIMSAESSSMP